MDTYSSPKKQYWLLKMILAYYEKSLDALAADASFSKLSSLPVRESIGRYKYTPEDECEARLGEIMAELDKQVRELTGGNEDA